MHAVDRVPPQNAALLLRGALWFSATTGRFPAALVEV